MEVKCLCIPRRKHERFSSWLWNSRQTRYSHRKFMTSPVFCQSFCLPLGRVSSFVFTNFSFTSLASQTSRPFCDVVFVHAVILFNCQFLHVYWWNDWATVILTITGCSCCCVSVGERPKPNTLSSYILSLYGNCIMTRYQSTSLHCKKWHCFK